MSSLPYPTTLLVTGGAGFIGSHLVRTLVRSAQTNVVNVDKLTYAADLSRLDDVAGEAGYRFVHADIADAASINAILREFQPAQVFHCAAETHVDRSIDSADAFLQSNICGTQTLLESALSYFRDLTPTAKGEFRLLHVSTDEVYGALGPDDPPFTEETPYQPRSPYAASKAAADHLTNAWHHTHGLPTIITHGSNNYGPDQHPEKLIPLILTRALAGEALPVYGDGRQVRDWLYVEDQVRGLMAAMGRGVPGRTYNFGGGNEWQNLHLVTTLCQHLDTLRPREIGGSYTDLITFVADRPGHDFRYALDTSRSQTELDWCPQVPFDVGLLSTVEHYLSQWQAAQE